MIGVIAKSDLVDPPRMRIALVDHNEYAQAVNGVEEAEITEVIDHHHEGDVVNFMSEQTFGSCTLVVSMFDEMADEAVLGQHACVRESIHSFVDGDKCFSIAELNMVLGLMDSGTSRSLMYMYTTSSIGEPR